MKAILQGKFVENWRKFSLDRCYVYQKYRKGTAKAVPFCVENFVEAVEVLQTKGFCKSKKPGGANYVHGQNAHKNYGSPGGQSLGFQCIRR